MNEQAYQNDFEFFLNHTDEKEVLRQEIIRSLPVPPVAMLDIGAGNGLLSLPIARMVNHYTAIESHPQFANKLQQEGLHVMETSFPVTLSQQFNFILVSHSLPYENYRPFITAAWEALLDGGKLLIVTYRGQTDDWTILMRQLGSSPEEYNRAGYNGIVELLYSFGDLKMRKVTTHVMAERILDMIEALSFVASDGNPTRKMEFIGKETKLQQLLQPYQNQNGFSFPFIHYFLEVVKS